ncbi:hypothetical protein [Martelella limonii]|uniref:hypothetical protein n=1 Tax=Martelella limonii TaxID=1647649 RepID=UPI00158095AD|nr:hypothetical protein [Martelella limonii]
MRKKRLIGNDVPPGRAARCERLPAQSEIAVASVVDAEIVTRASAIRSETSSGVSIFPAAAFATLAHPVEAVRPSPGVAPDRDGPEAGLCLLADRIDHPLAATRAIFQASEGALSCSA